eukprot:7404179-Alexandrium_andersonii.AAC.1
MTHWDLWGGSRCQSRRDRPCRTSCTRAENESEPTSAPDNESSPCELRRTSPSPRELRRTTNFVL